MVDTLAIEALYQRVSDRFVAEGTAAVNVFGWRTPAQHTDGNRIAWVPGDPSGRVGETVAPRVTGRQPRSLATLRELCTVTINAVDTSALEDEAAQYKAARLLRDTWFRAVYLAAHGTFRIQSEEWLTTKLERRYGAALRVVLAVDAVVPDTPAELAPVDLAADVATVLADVIEHEVTMPTRTGGGVDTQANKRMTALVTVADGDAACGVAMTITPAAGSYVGVRVNGVDVTVGNGTTLACACYFSGDGGTTARTWGAIVVGDTCHWNGSVAGYQLSDTDVVDFDYEEG